MTHPKRDEMQEVKHTRQASLSNTIQRSKYTVPWADGRIRFNVERVFSWRIQDADSTWSLGSPPGSDLLWQRGRSAPPVERRAATKINRKKCKWRTWPVEWSSITTISEDRLRRGRERRRKGASQEGRNGVTLCRVKVGWSDTRDKCSGDVGGRRACLLVLLPSNPLAPSIFAFSREFSACPSIKRSLRLACRAIAIGSRKEGEGISANWRFGNFWKSLSGKF